jgi:hypothetical protein
MHKQSLYLYNNIIGQYANLPTDTTMGYRKVYARPLKLYKGIDNRFTLKLLNGDQKLLNVVGQTLYWQLLDQDTAELKFVISKPIEGSDNSNVVISISEADLESVKSGFYTYSSYLVDQNNRKTILYGDSQYGASVMVEIVENSFPQVYPSIEITEFSYSENYNIVNPDNSFYSSAIDARPDLNSKNTAIHTAAIYSNDFSGVIEIEATLEISVGSIVQWSTIASLQINSDDKLKYINFYGIYNWVRFRYIPEENSQGTIDKILYRS